ncbi:alpha-L-arabinofuranosidase 1-like [Senna tora]|uniref:Alpha-L-arabinofuranosidase 1-like n=1 Tax=Senna tora TaxID=362788 RepID=A0A834WH48_9FABA|nr:alpha-L-arabinofuranosidase 1-like [Senna tora]
MSSSKASTPAGLIVFILFSLAFQCFALTNHTSTLLVDVGSSGRPIPQHFFGVFFEEINHAGAGGLWAELVNNRGFEAGGSVMPSGIAPWSVLGDESTIRVTTEATSCFAHNKIAVKLDIICASSEDCPRGVGLSNPGFWGMNIEEGKLYKVIFYVRSLGSIDLTVSFVGSDGKKLASDDIRLINYISV